MDTSLDMKDTDEVFFSATDRQFDRVTVQCPFLDVVQNPHPQ